MAAPHQPPAARHRQGAGWPIAVALTALLAGCSAISGYDKPLRQGEAVVGTRGDYLDWNYHSLLEYSSYAKDPAAYAKGQSTTACDGKGGVPAVDCRIHGHVLHSPGYVVALEKAPRRRLGLDNPREYACDCRTVALYFGQSRLNPPPCPDQPAAAACFIQRRLDDGERLFISHIARFAPVEQPAPRLVGQVIYDAYRTLELPRNNLEEGPSLPIAGKEGLFEASFTVALKTLEENLARDLETAATTRPYTHVLVYVMGWNTGEVEAMENFNNLSGFLLDAAERESPEVAFRPLVIGVTWPSAWSFGTSLADVALRGLSFFNKKNDADEVGLVWLSQILHNSLRKVRGSRDKLRVVAFGHSFGGRALSRAVHSCSLVRPDDCSQHAVDLAIGYLPADGRSRYATEQHAKWLEEWTIPPLPAHHEGIPYTDYRPSLKNGIPQAVFWSGYDTATARAAFMGSLDRIDNTLNASGQAVFHHLPGWCPIKITGDGRIASPPSLQEVIAALARQPATPGKVLLINASGFIQHKAPLHGGDAHSDIYSKEVGEATWAVVKRYLANPKEPPGQPGPPVPTSCPD